MKIGRVYYERNVYDIFYDGKLQCECFNHNELCYFLTTPQITIHNSENFILLKNLSYTDAVVELILRKTSNDFVDKNYYDMSCYKNIMMLYLGILKGYKHKVKNRNNIGFLGSDSISLSFGKFKTPSIKDINLNLDIETVNNTEIEKVTINNESFYTMSFDTEYGKLAINSLVYHYHFESDSIEDAMSHLIYNTMLIVNK